MPHVPLFASERFKGRSARGPYGDVAEEIDWSVGQVLDWMKRLGRDGRTLVIFTSDNGPWLGYGDHPGSAGPLREGKGTSFDGGVRVPGVMRWPGQIPAGGVCRELATNMDVLPTVAKLAGAAGRSLIDGKDLWPLLSGGPGVKTPYEAFFSFWGDELQAVRGGKWKLHLPHEYGKPDPPGGGGRPGKTTRQRIRTALYDLEADPGETADVAARHLEVVEHLHTLAERGRADLGDSLTGRPAKNVRPPGRVETPAGK